MYRKLRHSLQWKLMVMMTAIITIVITVIGSISYDDEIYQQKLAPVHHALAGSGLLYLVQVHPLIGECHCFQGL
ncbi:MULTISPECIES: hypothetical protein [unclassified Paenibacillus]|uniref:hypothetical protein n=1 Tax=unclassified Paenibacillus TaxID=185978 RepID=UPI0012E3BA23|nr:MULTISPECIES: hypothetical protein [unclassified Paenibacillus]